MKIVVTYKEDGTIRCVKGMEIYLKKMTEVEVVNCVKDENIRAGRTVFRILEIDDLHLEDVLAFLLGENKYKAYSDLDDIEDSLNEVGAQVANAYNEIYGLSESVNKIEKALKEVKKLVEEKEL